MKSAVGIASLLVVLNITAFGQQGPAGVVPTAVTRPLATVTPHSGRAGDDLSRNYRITLSFKAGDKPVREIVVLTASAQIKISAVLEQDEAGTLVSTTVELSGVLSENEDRTLRFSYQIGASIPRVSSTLTSRPTTDVPKNVATAISYVNESASGLLAMEPGKAYEIFKSAVRTYTLKVEPEASGKGK